MTIEKAIKDIQKDGIDLGAGDYVDVEALKVAVEVMKDYQRIIYENKRLRHEINNTPTMKITITKEQTDELGFKFE